MSCQQEGLFDITKDYGQSFKKKEFQILLKKDCMKRFIK